MLKLYGGQIHDAVAFLLVEISVAVLSEAGGILTYHAARVDTGRIKLLK